MANDGAAFDDAWRHTNIGRVLNNAVVRFEARVIEVMASAGQSRVRPSQIAVTRNLDLSGTRVTDLARRAGMSKQAMAESVEQCEALGLVRRSVDPLDARAKIVAFTTEGRAWLERFRAAIAVAEEEMRVEIGYLRVDAIGEALASYGGRCDPLAGPTAPKKPTLPIEN